MTTDCHMVGDKVALSDEVVILNREITAKVGPNILDDLFPTLSTLTSGSGGMVHHAFSNQLVDRRRLVACGPTTKQLFDHIIRLGRHDRILPAVEFHVDRRRLCTCAGNNWGNRRVKNDQRDAQDLAAMLALGRLAEGWIAPPEVRELRELVRYRYSLIRHRTSAKAQIHGVMAKNG